MTIVRMSAVRRLFFATSVALVGSMLPAAPAGATGDLVFAATCAATGSVTFSPAPLPPDPVYMGTVTADVNLRGTCIVAPYLQHDFVMGGTLTRTSPITGCYSGTLSGDMSVAIVGVWSGGINMTVANADGSMAAVGTSDDLHVAMTGTIASPTTSCPLVNLGWTAAFVVEDPDLSQL